MKKLQYVINIWLLVGLFFQCRNAVCWGDNGSDIWPT